MRRSEQSRKKLRSILRRPGARLCLWLTKRTADWALEQKTCWNSARPSQPGARTAEAEHDISVEVISTQAQVQGLAAISVHEPGRAFDADVREMTATARHARHEDNV